MARSRPCSTSPGSGSCGATCFNTGQSVWVFYINETGTAEMVSRSTIDQGLTSTVELGGEVLANNGSTQGTSTSATNTAAHLFTFDAGPVGETGQAGFSFRGTAFTKLNGANRCAVTGVAAIG